MDELIEALKVVLGTSFTLYLNLHSAHWNCEGINFPELHGLFGEQYAAVWESVDDTAEKIRQLDAYAPGTMERFIQLSRIQGNGKPQPPRETLVALLGDHETMIALLTETLHTAEKADQQGVVNYLAGLIENHAKYRWMLRVTAKKV